MQPDTASRPTNRTASMETSAFGTSNLSSRSLKINTVHTTQNEANCLKFTNPLREEFSNFMMGLG